MQIDRCEHGVAFPSFDCKGCQENHKNRLLRIREVHVDSIKMLKSFDLDTTEEQRTLDLFDREFLGK